MLKAAPLDDLLLSLVHSVADSVKRAVKCMPRQLGAAGVGICSQVTIQW